MDTSLGKFLRKAIEYLSYFFVFLLPWQIKFILRPAETNYLEISFYFSQLIILIILFLFLFLRIKFKENNCDGESRPAVYSLIALIVFVFISIFFAFDKFLAAYRYFILLTALCIFFIFRLSAVARDYQEPILNKITLIYSLLISIFIQSALAIYQFLTQSSFACKYLGLAEHNPATLGTSVIEAANGRWLRAYGGMDHPNILGGVLVISLLLAAYLLAKKKMLNTNRQIWSSVFLFSFYFSSLFALFFTFSRGAWLAFSVGLISLLFIFIIKKDKWILGRFIALIFFSLVLIGIILPSFRELVIVRLDVETRLEQKSITERQTYLVQARELLKNNFLVGVGSGNYTLAVGSQDYNKKPSWEYQPVHNAFLLFLVENGLLSFLSFCLFLFFLIKNGRREVFALAIVLPLFILMFLDHWLFSLPFGVLFLFLLLSLI